MNLKDLVWFLCAIALSTSKKIESDDDAASYAYSSVYRSFDTPAIKKEETKSKGAKTSSLPTEETLFILNPVYETIWTQEDDKPKPDEGAREITPAKTLDSTTNNKQEAKTVNENNTIQSIPNKQAETNNSKNTPAQITNPIQVKTNGAAVPVLVQTKAQSSPPLTMPIIQPGRLITPGLSAYASSKEEKEENDHAEVTDDNYESKESHETFDGFSSW